ncbi:MAG: hypothetical protein IJ801_01900 [Lachnospiraceae bacterium]|nr:hypothetical protein [Lachnospiraceae bacterium]
MSRKTEYNNRYNKEHYDRINMFMPKGYKEQIKSKADELEIGLSEYIFTLICNDLSGVSANISDQKQGLDDDGLALLKKWQVAKRYIEMIENVSYTTGNYYIQLKAGYINDVTGSREIHAKNSSEIRVVVTKSHK